jgi:hypothetical protein
MNSEIVERLPGSKLRGEPAWLFPATRASLSKILRISVFGKYLRVGAAHAMVFGLQLTQPFLKLGLFHYEFVT